MLANRIKCTTATTGTGDLTLSATGVRDAANGDCLAPAEALGQLAGRTVSYTLVSGNSFATGRGLLAGDGLTLTRDPRERRWNGSAESEALLSLAGTSTVLITALADDLNGASLGLTIAARMGAFLL